MRIKATVLIDVDRYAWEACYGTFNTNHIRTEAKEVLRQIMDREKDNGVFDMTESITVS